MKSTKAAKAATKSTKAATKPQAATVSAKVVSQQASLAALRVKFGEPNAALQTVCNSGKVAEFNGKRSKGALAVLFHALAAVMGASLAAARGRINAYCFAIEPCTEAASERGVVAKSVGDSPYSEPSFFGWCYTGGKTANHAKCKGYAPKALTLAATAIGRTMADEIAGDKALLPKGAKMSATKAIELAAANIAASLKA